MRKMVEKHTDAISSRLCRVALKGDFEQGNRFVPLHQEGVALAKFGKDGRVVGLSCLPVSRAWMLAETSFARTYFCSELDQGS
jgi:hypothetical protein